MAWLSVSNEKLCSKEKTVIEWLSTSKAFEFKCKPRASQCALHIRACHLPLKVGRYTTIFHPVIYDVNAFQPSKPCKCAIVCEKNVAFCYTYLEIAHFQEGLKPSANRCGKLTVYHCLLSCALQRTDELQATGRNVFVQRATLRAESFECRNSKNYHPMVIKTVRTIEATHSVQVSVDSTTVSISQ